MQIKHLYSTFKIQLIFFSRALCVILPVDDKCVTENKVTEAQQVADVCMWAPVCSVLSMSV